MDKYQTRVLTDVQLLVTPQMGPRPTHGPLQAHWDKLCTKHGKMLDKAWTIWREREKILIGFFITSEPVTYLVSFAKLLLVQSQKIFPTVFCWAKSLWRRPESILLPQKLLHNSMKIPRYLGIFTSSSCPNFDFKLECESETQCRQIYLPDLYY